MSKWIYRYLRADRREIDCGPYPDQETAQKESNGHAAVGAMTTGAVEVPDDYVLYQGDEDD